METPLEQDSANPDVSTRHHPQEGSQVAFLSFYVRALEVGALVLTTQDTVPRVKETLHDKPAVKPEHQDPTQGRQEAAAATATPSAA